MLIISRPFLCNPVLLQLHTMELHPTHLSSGNTDSFHEGDHWFRSRVVKRPIAIDWSISSLSLVDRGVDREIKGKRELEFSWKLSLFTVHCSLYVKLHENQRCWFCLCEISTLLQDDFEVLNYQSLIPPCKTSYYLQLWLHSTCPQ